MNLASPDSQLASFVEEQAHLCGQESRGLCFDASVRIAEEAVRLGIGAQVAFVRWRVRDDPAFLEHWAVALDDGRVLDPTAAQVDGDARPIRQVADYPVNYGQARYYPAPAVLEALGGGRADGGRRYAPRVLWSVHRRLFRHDAALAARSRSVGCLVDATRALARCAFKLAAGHLLQRALRYHRTLLSRPK